MGVFKLKTSISGLITQQSLLPNSVLTEQIPSTGIANAVEVS